MDEAFIIVSVISGIFGILGLELLTHNWFKKEKFKIQVSNIKKQNDLQLKKMARDLGLSSSPHTKIGTPAASSFNDLLEMGKQFLTPNQISGIMSIIAGGAPNASEDGEEEEGGGDLATDLLTLARKHPEEAGALLKGVMSKLPALEGSSEGVESGWI